MLMISMEISHGFGAKLKRYRWLESVEKKPIGKKSNFFCTQSVPFPKSFEIVDISLISWAMNACISRVRFRKFFRIANTSSVKACFVDDRQHQSTV